VNHHHHHTYLSRLPADFERQIARMRRMAGAGSIMLIGVQGTLAGLAWSEGHIVRGICAALAIAPLCVTAWLHLRHRP
jgi:hypothetical protein